MFDGDWLRWLAEGLAHDSPQDIIVLFISGEYLSLLHPLNLPPHHLLKFFYSHLPGHYDATQGAEVLLLGPRSPGHVSDQVLIVWYIVSLID